MFNTYYYILKYTSKDVLLKDLYNSLDFCLLTIEPQTVTIWPFTEKFAHPWSRVLSSVDYYHLTLDFFSLPQKPQTCSCLPIL